MQQVFLPSKDACPRLVLSAYLPDTYPSSTPPVLQLQAPYLSDDTIGWAAQHVEEFWVPGEVLKGFAAATSIRSSGSSSADSFLVLLLSLLLWLLFPACCSLLSLCLPLRQLAAALWGSSCVV